jgi:hypothetical protein
MRLFRKNTSDERRAERDHEDAVNDRMRSVLGKDTDYDDDADVVEQRLRNMAYGTNKR